MKKILIINTIGIGREGISSVIYNYCCNMNRDGVKLTFVSPSGIAQGVRKQFEMLGTVYAISDRKNNTKSYLREIWEMLRNNQYDVIHIHGNSGTMFLEVFIAKLCQVKKIIIHCHSTRCEHVWINQLLRIPMMWMATDLLACSRMAGDFLYGKKPFIVLNNAIDIKKYLFHNSIREKYRTEFGIGETEFLVGHAGNFIESKNHEFLLDVFLELHEMEPNAKLLLLSDGPLLEEIKEKVRNLNLTDSVIFAGRRADMAEMYQMMDIFVFPSKYEGLGLVMIEAQAAGLQIIASDAVPLETKCTEDVQYMKLSDGVQKWAEEIYNRLHHPNNRTKNNEKALRSKGFDITYEADKLRGIYME